jgi:hypothetical protein
MTNPNSTLAEDDQIGGGQSHAIGFQVHAAGWITVRSAPTTKPAHSETGALGAIALYRPGDIKPVKLSAPTKVTDDVVTLAYAATVADVALAGQWICRVTNLTDNALTWHTVITDVVPVVPPPVGTVSMDIELLNYLLSVVVAAMNMQIHLETSGDPGQWATRFSVQTETPDGKPNTLVYTRYLEDIQDSGGTWRLRIDSDPEATTVLILPNPLMFSVSIGFVSDGVALQSLTTPFPDIRFSSFKIGLDLGFDGTITPSCYVETQPATILWVNVPDKVRSNVVDHITALTQDPTFAAYLQPDALKANVAKYLSILLRLGPQEQIKDYRSDGYTLFVDHAVAPHPVIPPVGPPVVLPPKHPVIAP